MKPALAKTLRISLSVVSVLALLVALAVGWFYFQVRASLPQLDGTAPLAGLGARVTVERDALGVPTIRGATRLDVTRAIGYLHAQDRFFQMDLLRRSAAGELSELFGAIALPRDRENRRHSFRRTAQQALARLSPAERATAEAYTAGVNAGLASLGQKPFEYLALRTPPTPWLPEDCLLVALAMKIDLEGSQLNYERSLATLRDTLGEAAVAFFAPLGSPYEAPIDGSVLPTAPMPSAQLIDLRKTAAPLTASLPFTEPYPAGSNNFALGGAHTANGAALLANDAHLELSIPNTWYRAAFVWSDAGRERRVSGVTLPGAPAVVIGSNGHVAWGFTVAYADVSDLVIVQPNGVDRSLYRRGEEFIPMEHRQETIRVKGAEPVVLETDWTVWGPIIGIGDKNHPLAQRWTAHDPEALNFTFADMENATDVRSAVAIAHRSGIPALNLLIADDHGEIAWTVAGRLPKRLGYDGRLPVAHHFGDRRWEGLLPPDEVPTVYAGAKDRLWTANSRVVGGAALATLGDGGYDLGPRAHQVRDDLAALEHATPRDLLGVQLDDRAVFLARWQKLLLDTLTPDALARHPERAELRALVEKWEGRASIDSVSYRLVREFRRHVHGLVFTPIFERCKEANESFWWGNFHTEGALWTMLAEKPPHLLNPRFSLWSDLLLAGADNVIADLKKAHVPLDRATWGAANTARIRHPLASVLPAWLAVWLSMPADPLPGDSNMPRLQGPHMGASERIVVSPGHESEGILHQPGGQSGHPLSPYFRAGHEAWVRGEPTPFLPGATVHTLELKPQ